MILGSFPTSLIRKPEVTFSISWMFSMAVLDKSFESITDKDMGISVKTCSRLFANTITSFISEAAKARGDAERIMNITDKAGIS